MELEKVPDAATPTLEAALGGDRVSFFSRSFEELAAESLELFGAERYRAVQLFQWVYRRLNFAIDSMTDIRRALREELAARYDFTLPELASRHISSDGTRKYLFRLISGELIESVMIKQPNRMTLCVSSQVGCAMACSFCRTGTMGLKRHLQTEEIIGQVLAVMLDAKNFNDSFSNIVFMGMGEPLHNFDNVVRAISILNDTHGFQISPRKITVSSVGLRPAIERFFASPARASLALSLNATTDEVRNEIMPVNRKYPIASLVEMIRGLPLRPRESVTIEYVMLHGVNDSAEDLSRLWRLLRGLPVKANLIPYNVNAKLGYASPPREWVHEWQRELCRHGLQTTIRWSKGQDIDAACGQLATSSVRESRAA